MLAANDIQGSEGDFLTVHLGKASSNKNHETAVRTCSFKPLDLATVNDASSEVTSHGFAQLRTREARGTSRSCSPHGNTRWRRRAPRRGCR